jgi:glycolate oxidase FAD binding subunit
MNHSSSSALQRKPASRESLSPELIQVIDSVKNAANNRIKLLPRGGQSKPALTRVDVASCQLLDMRPLSGVLEYQPTEFTITARAGTTIKELNSVLRAEGQFLPFDPLFEEDGATLGGTIATGISGPGRLLYGGLRDFVIGIEMVDGLGELVRGGGKVVKNAAGFDLPKMVVGSIGSFGVLTELTLKVFPAPLGYRTLIVSCPSLSRAINAMRDLMLLPVDICAADVEPCGRMWIRMAGSESTTAQLATRLKTVLSGVRCEESFGTQEQQWWQDASHCRWSESSNGLVRVALTSEWVMKFDSLISQHGCPRRYSAAFNTAWVSLPSPELFDSIDKSLKELGLKGLVVRGPERKILGLNKERSFASRIQKSIDPTGVFADLP